ncbi:MAG TPA: LysE family translocator [Gaiellales bacterium]|jgi:threonine/homoserine/homoserine lactone efflux protein
MPGPYLPAGALGSLVVTAVAVMGSPGPATISLTAAGSTYGARRCIGYLAGIVAGTFVVLLAVASGITATLLAVPAVRPVLIALGAAYIVWLAYHIATAPPLAAQTPGVSAPSAPAGALLGVTNPKAWVAIAAVFASARLSGDAAADAAAKVAVLTVMIVVINTTWLLAGASLAPLLRDPRRARVVNPALALMLLAAAAVTVVR